MRYFIFIMIVLSLSGAATAAVINVPGDQPTIQAGIDAALPGDTVVLADGVYTGTDNKALDYAGKAIEVRSANGPDNCIIDCEGSGRGFSFDDGEGREAVVRGITIMNGGNNLSGGGISCSEASPTIVGCVITGCHADSGGGIRLSSSDVLVSDCLIIDNQAGEPDETSGKGGGVRISGGSPVLVNNRIIDNRARNNGYSDSYGGGFYCSDTTVSLFNNLVALNSADVTGGFHCVDSAVTMANCTLRNGLDLIVGEGSSSLVMTNCVSWEEPAMMVTTVTYSDIWLNFFVYPGEGNIDADPLWVDIDSWDFSLAQIAAGQASNSPCVDTGSGPASGICYNTADGTICMSEMTTRTDGAPDSGTVDMGFHYPAFDPPTIDCDYTITPLVGTVPFTTTHRITLSNLLTGTAHYTRRVAGRIAVLTGNGASFNPWRAGFTNINPASEYTTAFNVNLPAHVSVIGNNTFTLTTEDVTPAPYNQPPYPPSGQTCTKVNVVLANSP